MQSVLAPQPTLQDVINRALSEEVSRVIAEEAQEAAQRVERRVRESAASITGRVLQHFEMRYDQNRLIIEVKFPTGAAQ